MAARGVNGDGWRGEWAAGEIGEVGQKRSNRPSLAFILFLFIFLSIFFISKVFGLNLNLVSTLVQICYQIIL